MKGVAAMGELADAIDAAAGGNTAALLAACRDLPSRPGPAVDPQSDDDPGPISAGESFDDITAAWIMGRISDDVYHDAIRAATGG